MYAYIMSHRTQVTLTDKQYERLLEESQRTGLGIAALVRRALDESYGPKSGYELIEVLHESFGAWSDRDFDGEEYVERLRRGMARRLERL